MSEDTEVNSLIKLDGVLENTFATLANRNTGLGTSRSKTESAFVNVPEYLTEEERVNLFRSSTLCRKVVTLPATDAAKSWFDITSDADSFESQKLLDFFEELPTGSLREKFVEASCEARLHGDAYILLGIDDGQEWDQPLDENKIKNFRWAEVLYHDEVTPDFLYGIKPRYYWITSVLSGGIPNEQGEPETNSIKVHASRILRFPGYKLYGRTLYNNAGKNDSVLQPMFSAFSQYYQSLMSASAMMADYNVFTYQLKGLKNLIDKGEQDALLQRFLLIQMGMSVTKGLMMDADNESADFITRNFGGVKDIIQVLQDHLVSSTDIPRFKLLGDVTSNGSLDSGNKTEQQRFEWASWVKSWQIDNWEAHLKKLCKYAFLARNTGFGGKIPPNYDIKFNSIFEQSPLEEQEMRLKKAQEHKFNIENKIYTSYEARMSTYGKSEWNAEVTLDDRMSKRMEEEMLNPPEPVVVQAPNAVPQKTPTKNPVATKKSPKKENVTDSSQSNINRSMQLLSDLDYNKDMGEREDVIALEAEGKSLSQKEFDKLSKITEEDVLVTIENIVES